MAFGVTRRGGWRDRRSPAQAGAGMHSFLEAVQERPILFDGAIGTELYKRGVFLTNNFEELNLSKPSLVLEVHRDYRKAGAEVLTTNSYGANRFRLERFGLATKLVAINQAAAQLAVTAADSAAWVAGSIGPSGLGVAEFLGTRAGDLVSSLEAQIQALLDGGADLLLFETYTQLGEMQIALATARRVAADTPVLATMRFEPNERLLDGSEPEAVAEALESWGANVIGVNCGEGPDLALRVGQRMLGRGVPVMAQPNAGTPEMLEGRTLYVGNPEYFGVFGRRMLKAGIRVVGGCCGTSPDHIHRMRGAARMMGGAVQVVRAKDKIGNVRDATVRAIIEAERREPVPVEQRSELAKKMTAGKFVVSVEVNPPFGLDATASIEAARMLRDAGVDVINTADGPRATVRMSNLAQAVLVQRELGMETLLHVCCRDRNLLGLQSDLLGAHALGIRNLVIITGDPPKLGDYPDATAVYDVDSIGLLKFVDGYNHGVDPSGKSMPAPTEFWVGTGVEPGAMDYEREIRRLEQKIEAGAHFVMTQPVYDPRSVERLLDDVAHLHVPILLGLLPLASYRNAEFLHNEVPGIVIPEEIRLRMKAAGGGEKARAEGVKIAQEALLSVRGRIQGAYIMPPFGRFEMAVQILEALGDSWKQWP
jgi:methionine synthase I (cobalamin-dependent)/5,10-methylenetetrahydrofolate reductase